MEQSLGEKLSEFSTIVFHFYFEDILLLKFLRVVFLILVLKETFHHRARQINLSVLYFLFSTNKF